jgi:hypothetical protein
VTVLKPAIPGTVIRFTGDEVPRIAPSFAETVAVPIIHDWGPLGSDAPTDPADPTTGGSQLCASFAEFTAIFGDSDTPGRTAVAGAFAGQGLPGAGGAGAVLVYRMGTSAAARAVVNLMNTAGTPAQALRLTALYKGVRGNDLSVVVGPDPVFPSTQDRLRIRYKGVVQESYSYAKTDIAALAAAINARSTLVTATSLVTGTALAVTSGTSLAGGDSGTVVTSTETLAALDGLEFQPFSVLAFHDLTDSGIQASVLSWVRAQDEANRPVVLVVGGAAGETVDTAVARSAALDDPHVVNFGVGTFTDDLVGKDLSTAQLAPRIAGILVARGQTKDLTYARIAGLHIVGSTGPASDEVRTAIDGGVNVLMRATAADAELLIAEGVTTYIDDTADKPRDVFGDPRLVRVMDIYVRNMKRWGDDNVIGGLVNDDTRAAVRGEGRRLQDEMLLQGLISPGTPGDPTDPPPFVTADDPHDPALADAVPYRFGWRFSRTARFILGDGRIR